MCGRFTIRKPVTKTVDIVNTNIKVEDNDNYNAHPTQQLPIIKSYSNGKALELCEWGLVPAWSKKLDKFSPLINARKETLMEKVTFKNLIQTSRCIVPADGYYQWIREDKTKTPFYFTKENDELMFFAAIYQNDQFCLITEEASENIKEIHHRQPVILNQTDVNRYLNLELSGSNFLKECKKPNLIFYEISKDVNKPTNNSVSLIQPINN